MMADIALANREEVSDSRRWAETEGRAGNGNRTRITCLEGRSFAFKLYPHTITKLSASQFTIQQRCMQTRLAVGRAFHKAIGKKEHSVPCKAITELLKNQHSKRNANNEMNQLRHNIRFAPLSDAEGRYAWTKCCTDGTEHKIGATTVRKAGDGLLRGRSQRQNHSPQVHLRAAKSLPCFS